ncbi:MAG TPA: hypothetical protein VJZ03_08075, partial [Candidatus Bathyarchaeia archaeon]|nr:hypothetical protein [Candidatus Bathyarchaeia archaeon]
CSVLQFSALELQSYSLGGIASDTWIIQSKRDSWIRQELRLSPMSADEVESLGLKEPLDRKKIMDYMRKFKITPYRSEGEGLGGLYFRPHIGWTAGKRFQEILHLYSREVDRLKSELESPY